MNPLVKIIPAFCLLVLLLPDVTLGDKKQGLILVEQIKMHLARGGGGWIEVSSTVCGASSAASAGTDFDTSHYDILAEYGVKNRKTHSVKLDGQKMRVVSRGEFADILQFVRILDSGSSFLLSHHKTFDIGWDDRLFKLHMKYGAGDVATTARPKRSHPTLEISTDGRFTENSTGQLSENRSKIIINLAEKKFLLEIEELGIE